jgi:drug/metabolite transporter (DMT)-like permease
MAKNAKINPRIAFLGYGACFVAGCLWGTGFYFGRLALNEMSVEYMVLYRFLFASLGMLPVAFIHRHHFRLSFAETRLLLLCAFLGVPLQFLLQFHGLALTTVSHASLMVGAVPVMLAIWVLGPLLLTPLTRANFALPPFAHVSPTAWIALAISGLFCTATTTLLWNWGIHHVPASRAGVFLNIEPALGAWLGVQLLGERLGPFAWVGGGLILAAAVALTTRGRETEPAIILE